MGPEARTLWYQLELESSPTVAEASWDEIQQRTSLESETMYGALHQLFALGAIAELDGKEIAALAQGRNVGGNVLCLTKDAHQSLIIRVHSREQVRYALQAKRELLQRQLAAFAQRHEPTRTVAWIALDSLKSDARLVEEAKQYALTDAEWRRYGTVPHSLYYTRWQQLGAGDRAERVRMIAVLLRRITVESNGTIEEQQLHESLRRELEQLSGELSGLQARAGDHVPPGRGPIPKEVQHEVWRRDQGRCVQCGGQDRVEFDHIIPMSRGGSNTARNVQLLCEQCNRQKGNRI